MNSCEYNVFCFFFFYSTHVSSRWLFRPLVLRSRVGWRFVGKRDFPVEQLEFFDRSVAVHRPRYVVVVLVSSVLVTVYFHGIRFACVHVESVSNNNRICVYSRGIENFNKINIYPTKIIMTTITIITTTIVIDVHHCVRQIRRRYFALFNTEIQFRRMYKVFVFT